MRKSIESMTSLHVVRVDVHVQGVSFEKENQEMQLSQKAAMDIDQEEEQGVAAEAAKEEPVSIVEVVETEDDFEDEETEEEDSSEEQE